MSQPSHPPLPVHACLPEIISAVEASVPVVLKAPPGAGKTTGVPPALLQHKALLHNTVTDHGKVLLVQPRRLAARASASRLAWLLDSKLGQRVGYHIRFDRCVSANTQLVAMTTGVLLRRLQEDPLLEDVDCVLLDEFHERSLEVDLALGMLKRIRETLRPELKLVVMSATLDPQPIVDFLGDARAVVSAGRSFPVDVQYTRTGSQTRIEQQVAEALPMVLAKTDGHVLVFLPGVGEIRRTRRLVEALSETEPCRVLELFGDLPAKDQDAVLGESEVRKIVLATNVAETSITIPGVTAVIDSGLARVLRFDAHVGMPKLQLEPISQASAEQRAGRAGRTEHGICVRLWPRAAHRSRPEQDAPEVVRSDFSGAMLTLAGWGERDADSFPWLTAPPEDAVRAARRLLIRLDAIEPDGALTSLGQQMLKLPLHPRISRFMIEATMLGMAEEAAVAAALLTERDPFRGQAMMLHSGCDIEDRVERFHLYLGGDTSAVQNPSAAKQVKRVADQIVRLMRGLGMTRDRDVANEDRLKRALLAAYPDRVARRRAPGDPRGVMVGGRGVRLDDRSSVRSAELYLCIDVDGRGTEAAVRLASEIDKSWLDDKLMREVDEPYFDSQRLAVVARRRNYFDDLLLRESPIECKPDSQTGALLFGEARSNLKQAFPDADRELSGFIHRVRFLNRHMPELEIALLDDDAINEVLHDLCRSRTSFQQLRSAPWLDHLRGRYDYRQQQLIDQHAPTRMVVPSGNSIAIDYASGTRPTLAVRIQELFGWKQTPLIAGGRVPLQLHLLGPNHRPQQVTEDLANFWKETYVQVRKDLRGRYPKHHWPEDPIAAQATRNGLKPKT